MRECEIAGVREGRKKREAVSAGSEKRDGETDGRHARRRRTDGAGWRGSASGIDPA